MKINTDRTSLLLIVCGLLAAALIPAGEFLWAQGFAPKDAVKRMKVADDLEVRLVASEPDIRQPVTMDFDARGRLWVIQYIQYPTPAGLKPVKVDQYLRTVYDRVPEPPPKGPKGADRITILEADADSSGHYHKVKDFVTGLNLASGMCLGHGGVFVAQPPYLLFYPDRNGDDIPDSDPEVLLTGFGMQDAHAFANSLQWGPDGWLYGAQGSTVTAHIRGIEFQQGIWRYHPVSRQFELFAEGGGNTWGLDFDRHGNAIAGTNYGHSVMLHQVQGAYYIKGFAKHGELHNPHAYGYFDHVPYDGFKGGHVTCGGIIYEGGAFPKRFDHTYIAANPLANAIYWHVLDRNKSTFTAHLGGDLLLGNDTWFRPVDCLVGPDGSVFVADWYDKRINHVDPVDNWDRSNGRIYQIRKKGGALFPLSKPLRELSSKELIELLSSRNEWLVREAWLILAERRDRSVIPSLRKMVLQHRGQLALEALWALYVSGGFDDELAAILLDHANIDVRVWTVRFLGDAKRVSPIIEQRLIGLARKETSCAVRSQLACTCKRLPGKDAVPIIRALLRHTEDVRDPHIPLLLWWAIEDKAISDRERVLALLDTRSAWQNSFMMQFLIERLGRRYMAEGQDIDLATCARLLARAPGSAQLDLLIKGMELALQGHRLQHVFPALEKEVTALWNKRPSNLTLTRFAMRLGSTRAYQSAVQRIGDPKSAASDRLGLIEILGQIGQSDCVPALLKLLDGSQPATIRLASLSALQPFRDAGIAKKVLALYPKMPGNLRTRAQTLLFSRPTSSRLFLQAVDRGRIPTKDVPFDQLRRILLHRDPELIRLVEKYWGKITPATTGEKRARIASIHHMLGLGKGNPINGQKLFVKNCATCHTLFGEGNKIGPDLTGADRKNRQFMITSIVDPSAVIRNEYVAYIVYTKTGRVLTGLIAESTPKTITLLDDKNEHTLIAREDIEEIKASPQSLMPEKILDPLDDQQICDLFSYLESNGPGPHKE